jgi:hypothetical protein
MSIRSPIALAGGVMVLSFLSHFVAIRKRQNSSRRFVAGLGFYRAECLSRPEFCRLECVLHRM